MQQAARRIIKEQVDAMPINLSSMIPERQADRFETYFSGRDGFVFRPRIMCRYFKWGQCKKDDRCPYAHCFEELMVQE